MLNMKLEKIALITTFLLPIIFIAIACASILIPKNLAPKPKYSFIYSINTSNYSIGNYVVEQNQLKYNKFDGDKNFSSSYNQVKPTQPKLFKHDPATNQSKQITLLESELYNLTKEISPDGYTFLNGEYSGLRTNKNLKSYYLSGHDTSFKPNLQQITPSSENNKGLRVEFLAWIKNS